MSDDTIKAVAVLDTDFGEVVAIDSPYESKDYISHLPWKEYSEEVAEYGSLKQKAADRGTNVKTSQLTEVFDAMESYGFSDDFCCHQSWDPEALGEDGGAWTIDREAWPEAADFFQYAGFDVEVADGVSV
mgnify:FL=1